MTIKDKRLNFRVGFKEGFQDIWSEMRRGFVSHIHLRTGEFLTYAKEIFSSQPVVSVELWDRPAHQLGRIVYPLFCHTIGSVNSEHFPPAVWEPLYRGQVPIAFESRKAADEALSLSLVNYGRLAAGLLPIGEEEWGH